MHRNDIAELAKGMAPFVRECVAEATALSPELAEQVASAVRLLHESPPIVQRSEAPQPPPPPKVTRVERDADGALVLIYDQSI